MPGPPGSECRPTFAQFSQTARTPRLARATLGRDLRCCHVGYFPATPDSLAESRISRVVGRDAVMTTSAMPSGATDTGVPAVPALVTAAALLCVQPPSNEASANVQKTVIPAKSRARFMIIHLHVNCTQFEWSAGAKFGGGKRLHTTFILSGSVTTHSAVAGSMRPVTCEILLAGNPPSSAWRRTNDSSVA
jgi:hypothetical protein